MAPKGRQAIVLGGSMAGLLAARVLADHFERVTIIERDRFPANAEGRRGVPQGAHVHGFWPRGLGFIERKLPGVTAALEAAGSGTGDAAHDCNWYQFDGLKHRADVGVRVTFSSRPFLESRVRARVLAIPNVTAIEEASVHALVATEDRSRIVGVKVERRGAATQETITADYVVDATGRAGHAARWLESLGYDRAPQSEVRIDVTYATRTFTRTPGHDAIAHIVVATPPAGKRGGVAFAIEGDRWIVTLVGFMGEVPPTDVDGFREYARSLPFPGIHGIVQNEQVITDATVFKFPSNLRRHYERLARFPEGFLVIGDAMTSFNPAYGQGMTVAALEAELLESCLARTSSTDGLARRFFKQAKSLVDVPWMITTGEDLRYPEATGKRPPLLDTINGYFTRLHHAATVDPVVCRAFIRVASFEAGPPSVFAPGIVWRVLRGERRYRKARSEPALRGAVYQARA